MDAEKKIEEIIREGLEDEWDIAEVANEITSHLKSTGWLDPDAQAKAKCDFCQGRRSFPSGTGTPRENQPCPTCLGKGEVGLIFNGRPLLNKETAQAALEGWHVRRDDG